MRVLYCRFKTILFLTFACIFFNTQSFGQKYGLGFSSHEVFQDKRTSLDLTPDKPLCFNDNFDISFELSLFPNQITYFGYILRIIEDDKRNIDLVYNAQNPKNHINIIIGEKLSKANFEIEQNKLFNQWNKFKIKFDFDNDRLVFYNGHTVFTESGLHLKKNACYKILFGTNNYKEFQTTDVPPMKLRDIRISQNGALKYNWPLDEESGTVAHEVVAQKDAIVINPVWISAMHENWQKVKAITVNGIASVAFNTQKETMYIVASDTVYSYSVNNSQWLSNANPVKLNLNQGNQSFYNKFDNSLYNFFPDLKFVAKYSFENHTWDKKINASPVTDFWHINKLISGVDSSMYLFGGYGHLLYKNSVKQYKFNSHTWQDVKYKGDFFTPRYLAALGSTSKGDTAYILGGYGNTSGQQILNPKNIYDMMRFTVKDKTFKKLFELKVDTEDFAFANSLVIDDKAKTYYGLIFSQHKYNSSLQLISGSLKNASYKLLGNTIPYNFHDVHSFADLYYCPLSRKFIAVTLLRTENNQTKINIYTLLGPPNSASNKISTTKSNRYLYILALILIIAIVASVLIYNKNKARTKKKVIPIPQEPVLPVIVPKPVTIVEPQPAELVLTVENEIEAPAVDTHLKNSIYLFGDLQVFDAEGTDITKYFTPLIKELFLLILLYSVKKGRGLSSEKLNEILWFDKSTKSARNNRSVNITKLKTLLDRMNHCHLSKNTGYWKIEIDYNFIYIDYHNYLSIVKDKGKLDWQKIKCLSDITQRGNFLSNIEYEWLDTFKSEISNEVIDTYLQFAQSSDKHHNPESLVEMANYIFYFDPVNEEAMILKCKALSALGKHSLVKHTFENFTKEYKTIYNEDFKKSFHAIME